VSEALAEGNSPEESDVRSRFRDALAKIAREPMPISDAVRKTHRHWSDGELVAALVDRQRGAFAELYRRHQRSVTTCSRKILDNEVESDNVTIEIFIRFWLDPVSFDANRGTLLSFLRAQAKRRSNELLLLRSPVAERETGVASEGRTRSPDVGSYTLTTPAATQLRRALTLLPPDEREPIELAFFGGLSYDAVAKHLRLPTGMVKARIHNGLERLHSTCGAPSNWQSPHLILSSNAITNAWRSTGGA
jgi:RNA polymerase sigma-70 factor (ECF subfamily)